MSHVKVLLLVASISGLAFAGQTVYDSGDPSAQEQFALELINRARANPTAEGTRLKININEGLDAGLSAVPRPPLAMNKILLGTARAHSQDMYTNSYFAHDSKDGKSPFDRMIDAGYSKPGAAALGENIAAATDLEAGGLEDLLMVDENYPHRGHRVNLLNIGAILFREVGVGYSGNATSNKQNLNNYLTEDFGNTLTTPFLVGVVYNDKNGNNFYDIGEGVSGVTVTPDSGDFMAVTGTAGGYAFPVATVGTIMVTISGGPLGAPVTLPATLGLENVKLDFKVNAGGAPPPAAAKITSALNATGTVGAAFSYTITASGTAPISFSADLLPNGLTLSGDKISGSPAAAGTYVVPLTATNAAGTDSQSLTITVAAVGGGGSPPPTGSSTKDTDGDGFPDELEKALSSSSTDATSTPSGISGASPQTLSASKMQIKLNFAKTGADSITLSGLLPIPAGFDPAGKIIVFDIGGVTRSFLLDDKRQAKSDNGESVKVGVKLTKKAILAQDGKVSAKFKGTLSDVLADEGLVNATSSSSVSVPIYVIFNNGLHKGAMTLGYKAKQDKSGTAK